MEQKLQNLINYRFQIDRINRKVNALVISPDENQLKNFVKSLYKSYTGIMVDINSLAIPSGLYPKYEKIEFHRNLVIIQGFQSIQVRRTFRFNNESIIKYYKSKLLLKNISDIINFNVLADYKPNTLIIVFTGNEETHELLKYKGIIESYKIQGIIYPKIIIINIEDLSLQDEIIERYCIMLKVSRSSFHFIACYDENEWKISLSKDYYLLQMLSQL